MFDATKQTPIAVLDHGYVRLVDVMGDDLSIVRNARQSFDAQWRAGDDAGSDRRLLNYLWMNRHTTPFESVEFQFEVHAPIFVVRQWHRHRTWCLGGDAQITFEQPSRLRNGIRTAKTVKLSDLARKWNADPTVKRQDKQTRTLRDFNRDRIRAMHLRVFNEATREFTTGHICDVIESGVKPVFEVTLADGKTLPCSKDHLMLTTEGWQRLEDAIGLVVHGETTGMTKEAHVLTNGYMDGHAPWNKGVTGYKAPRITTAAHKEAIRAARSGPNSNFWKGGVTSDRANVARWTRDQAPKVHARFDYTCQDCGTRGGRLHAHHVKSVVDHPELARDLDNLVTLCESCHKTRHGQSGDGAQCRGSGRTLRAMSSRVVAVRLIGEEMTYDISVAGDCHNFVANGMIVHNSYNELSARYTDLPEEFYVPAVEVIGTQSKSNKQTRNIDPAAAAHSYCIREGIADACAESFAQYRELLDQGCPRELARGVLPMNTYTNMFAKVDLLNLLKFLDLRMHPHAQWEMQEYARALLTLIEPHVPNTIATWRSAREQRQAMEEIYRASLVAPPLVKKPWWKFRD